MSKIVTLLVSLLLFLLSLALQGCGDNATGTPTSPSLPVTTHVPSTTTKLLPVTATSTTGRPSSCPEYTDQSPGAGLAAVESTPVGQSASTSCVGGFVGNTVTCTDIGVFSPTPNCTIIEDYCLAYRRNNAKTLAARLGATVPVTCTETGYVPLHAETVCKFRGVLEPTPFCTSSTATTSTTTTAGVFRRALRGIV